MIFIEAFFKIVLQLDEISKVRSFAVDKFTNSFKSIVFDDFFIFVDYFYN